MFGQQLTVDYRGRPAQATFRLVCEVAIILLIACANISGLMLARASTRTKELAIRTALGASLLQITLQFVTRNYITRRDSDIHRDPVRTGAGETADAGVPHVLATGFVVQSNIGLVLAAAGFGLVTSLLSSIAPVVEVARSYKALRLAEHGKGTTASSARQRFRGLLVSMEIALAFLLVTGTGLFLSSLRQLENVDPGFKSEGVLTRSVTLNASAIAI